MPDFEHSTLWRISSFDEMRERDGEAPTLLPTTLLSDLNQLQRDPSNDDVLEVIAACLRHRESALLYLGAHVLLFGYDIGWQHLLLGQALPGHFGTKGVLATAGAVRMPAYQLRGMYRRSKPSRASSSS